MPRISFKPVKSRIKNIQCLKQGASQCKMVRVRFHFFAKIRDQIYNAVKADRGMHSADCQCKNRHTADSKVRCLNWRAECHGPVSSAVFNKTAAVRSKCVVNH
jgi:hypothetical protein